ncbi:L-lactate dehydrogenase (quinone) large subunit LdhH [Pectinatus cerevisiiphilus]|uniref:Iron-sulfur cluster protein n=1 Tax=Pectinatus cerevisiiphilus TaxID=86956 RepID=A0A4R3KCS6_9FIRM|nr:LUD domain-containing protein [Pectinatus cerevisiiphilus]TCS80895.1 iron-sulfur cluster protein [Pectinatus cerevisiiphilus]
MANRNIKVEIKEKLHDGTLRSNLERFSEQYPTARAKAYANVESIEALRDDLKDMKSYAVAHIEELADEFQASLEKRGAKVFRAKDGDQLKQQLMEICRENGVHNIVKSKSMATEEIKLNDYLEQQGLHVKETDLGEWMLSVAGQHPSHMVMPAIHLNRKQCAKFFSDELKEDIPSDIPFMVQTARRVMREEFLKADMGISGANFGIAENGAIGLVTNEGNARIVTTLPPVHVIIIGYEKLIPKVSDASKIMRLLPRNGTCQRMVSYLTLIDGPTPIIHEKNGKMVEENKKVYAILLDNGRLKAAHDPVMKEVYQCVRCASCLNVCPIWSTVGGNVYGHIYSGGIGAILTGLLNSLDDFAQFSDLCIGCRRCTTVCPGKINIPDLIQELRNRRVAQKGLSLPEKLIFQKIMTNRKLFHTLLRTASIGQKPVKSGKFIRNLPLFFAKMTEGRSLPTIADKPFRDRTNDLFKHNPASPKMKVAFFSGCNLDFVFPQTGESVVKVLQDIGAEVVYPQDQNCCGKPVIGAGDLDTARKLAKKNIEALESANADYIIAACPTCAETLEKTYKELFVHDPAWLKRADNLSKKIREFTSFVEQAYEKDKRLKVTHGKEKITYHDSCHMRRSLGIYKEPRKLLESAAGYDYVEMNGADQCCGMAGSFGMKYADLSVQLLNRKLHNIKESGAQTIAVACPACMMQIGGGLDKNAPEIKIKHIADVLAENLSD